MPLCSNSLDSFEFAKRHSLLIHSFRKCYYVQIIETASIFALAMGDNKHVCTLLVQLGQADHESANYSYSELSYVSAKLYRSSVD